MTDNNYSDNDNDNRNENHFAFLLYQFFLIYSVVRKVMKRGRSLIATEVSLVLREGSLT